MNAQRVSEYEQALAELRGEDPNQTAIDQAETLWDQQVTQFLMLPEDPDRQPIAA
jgi:hypothetical protein